MLGMQNISNITDVRRLQILIENQNEEIATLKLKLAEAQAMIELLKHRIDQVVTVQVMGSIK